MKTLVIHPYDTTTKFLSVVYEGKDWTVLTDWCISKSQLREQIKSHDRIILMGHGTQDGLIAFNTTNRFDFRYVITSQFVYLLRQKQTVCIWCNANEFVNKYELKGFYTGMIISEYEEALAYSIHNPQSADIEQSNLLFADAIREGIDSDGMLQIVKSKYVGSDNNIIDFNSQNLFFS